MSLQPQLECALSKMKKRKAGEMSGILPELVLYGGALLWDRLLELMQGVWEEGKVVKDRKNAVVVPIPKKDDLIIGGGSVSWMWLERF